MLNPFFERPILNSPYEVPKRHWELDESGQPTQKVIESRRPVRFITPIPKAQKQSGSAAQQKALTFTDEAGLSAGQRQYDLESNINEIRNQVSLWRAWPNPREWQVTPETARLLQHWRQHEFTGVRPFFCQIEAVETAIWLTEVAAKSKAKSMTKFIDSLKNSANEYNPGLIRLALKLATGAGKTTVMAMLIAWQAVNAARHRGSKSFTNGFLIVTPGITIKDRLQVLMPNDVHSYYTHRDLVPSDMLEDVKKAKIVITNYHAFKLRETLDISKGGRQLLQGRQGEELSTLETEGQMIQRVMPQLMGMKNILAINDEAHHCYREKQADADGEDSEDLKGDERKEAEQNNEAARLWISGLEAVNRKLGIANVLDLSATPFFLRGSGEREGTLFPWTVSDFSLMDAIECGIVKLPRVPIADNISGAELPMYRNLWEHIRTDMPKKGRGKAEDLDPQKLPAPLLTALEALYGHYVKTFESWEKEGLTVPPCFIVVCQNTSISKLIYEYISGYVKETKDGTGIHMPGKLELFRNTDEHGNPLPRPRSLLIDSEQLESGEELDDNFRLIFKDEIERFRNELIQRTGNLQEANNITDQTLLRQVMNTVGKSGELGSSIRCVVSVSMLTEGWDANNVTHILGVRAFRTQLLCEQVIGRALRRNSYELNEHQLFGVEYADVLGIPFDFTAKPVVAPIQTPRETIQVKAVRPDRDALEIRFPRVVGYRVEMPQERLTATFTDDHRYILTPEQVGATETRNSGIIGEPVDLNLVHTGDVRPSQVLYELTGHLLLNKYTKPGEAPPMYLFSQLKRICKEWLDNYLQCKGGTYPAQLKYKILADTVSERIVAAINSTYHGQRPITAMFDPYNPIGSTSNVRFTTTKTDRWQPRADRCHINWIILDSGWEGEFCRVVESHPQVRAYVKNHNLGLEVPYRTGGESHLYRPDFIVLVDDGHGDDDLLRFIIEIKGYRAENAKDKKLAMETYWIPAVNNSQQHGRWAFAEFTDVYQIQANFKAKMAEKFEQLLSSATKSPQA